MVSMRTGKEIMKDILSFKERGQIPYWLMGLEYANWGMARKLDEYYRSGSGMKTRRKYEEKTKR